MLNSLAENFLVKRIEERDGGGGGWYLLAYESLNYIM